MAGYTRQSTADIIPTATVRAAPINAEYNALRDAFAASGGHKHDGTTGEGEYVPLIADLDANNKVQVNTGANTVDFYVEVSGVPVQQISVRDGVIRPITDNDIDLGATGAEFKDLYIDGIGYIDTLAVHENATVAGTLNVTGVITAPAGVVANITGNLTGNVTGDITGDLTGDVTSTGTSTFADIDAVDLAATGTTVITSGDINSGTIDNSVIGSATPAAGTFTTLNANTSLTAATADINGGTIDGATIGATSHTTGKFTTLQSTGQATLNTVDINGGNIDGTVIGAVGTAAGSFTTLSTTGQGTFATVDINGGSIDGTAIGASSASSGAFTTVSASGGLTGNLTGNVTGNLTGNVTGAITGNVTGDLTGNVTSAGTSTFNNVTIDGTLNMNAGTTATITNLTSPTNTSDAATKGYVDTQVSNLVDSAPGTLDTLNELAAALGDDADFSTTVTNSIATKLPLAGGTMTGAIAMSTNKITGAGDPTAAQDVATKAYVDTQRDTRVAKAGDTMSGNLAMGSNKVTGLAAPTDANDATSKTYVDGILGSATAAAASAAAAATSESNAATSETNASNSASAASTSEANAAASYDNFDDRYLGAKSSAPTVDNDGDALIVGALYFNNTTNIMNVYGSGGWQSAGSAVNGTSDRVTYTATAGQTVFAATYDTGYVDVYLNGVKLVAGTDFTATNGTSITLATGAAVNDVVDIVAYGTFVLADHYTEAQSDARYVQVAGDTMTGNLTVDGTVTADGLTVDGLSIGGTGGLEIEDPSASGYGAHFSFYDASSEVVIGGKTAGSTNKSLSIGRDTGDISFYEDTGTTPKMVWKSADERLGIGTSSPSDDVEISTSADAKGLTIKNAGNNRPYLNFDSNRSGAGNNLAQLNFKWNGADVARIIAVAGSDTTNKDDGHITFNTSLSGSVEERMRIDNSGNVGIGTSLPTYKVDVAGTNPALRLKSSAAFGYIIDQNTSSGLVSHIVYENVDMRFGTNSTERMRLDSSGNLLVGGTSAYGTSTFTVGADGDIKASSSSRSAIFNSTTSGYNGTLVEFRVADSPVGSIGTSGSDLIIGTGDTGLKFFDGGDSIFPVDQSTGNNRDNAVDIGYSSVRFKDAHFSGTVNAANFNTTSDSTLKTNVKTLTGSLDAVKSLRGVSFDWLENGNSEVGVIAQEVEAVLPDVVSTNDQGIKSVKYGNMVALLIEAMKEQQLRIEALEAQLNS